MTQIDAKTVMELRKMTGAPMMECKAALRATDGDMEKAVDVLRKQGLQAADKRAGRAATEGQVFSYLHHNGKLGVLVEVACETDFVARNEEFRAFGKGVCLTVAAFRPQWLRAEDVDEEVLKKERDFFRAQTEESMKGRPAEIVEKAVEGRLRKWLAERTLLDMPYVPDDSKTVEEVRKELVAKIGENIQVRRFVCMELGG